jgi:serine/threonine protein kinase
MDTKRIQQLVPGVDIDELWVPWLAAHPEGDLSLFAAELHKRGVLTQPQLRELLTEGEVSFTISEAITARKGIPTSSYTLLGLLGKGAMGEVHIARDTDLHRNVAVKLMDPGLSKDPILARRFLTEVQVTAQLDHPSIVPVYGLERRPDGTIGYSMRIIRGQTLEAFIEDTRAFYRNKRKPDETHALSNRLLMFQELCNALHYAHNRGVVHRDLKPENIMIGSYGEVMVMDWGIARLIGTADEAVPVMPPPSAGRVSGTTSNTASGTQVGTAIGTPPYMSPEQAEGRNAELDGRSDQYALGLILFELVALKRAVTGKTVLGVMSRAADGDKDDFVHAFGEPIAPELAAIVQKATAFEPRDRYADVDALATDVRRFMRDEPILAAPDRGLARVTRWISQHRQATLGGIVGLVGVLFVVAGSLTTIGAVALGATRYLANQREVRLAAVIGAVNDQAHAIDGTLERYASLQATLAGAAEYALGDDSVPERAIYLAPAFADPATAPPDLRPSTVYDTPASLDFPDNALAPGVDPAAVALRLQQLNALQPLMKKLLLRSRSEDSVDLPDAEQRALILDRGVPMVWNYVAVEEGFLTGIPGTGEYPPDYDPRTQEWYSRTVGVRGQTWNADDDESGQGMLITVSSGLHDAQGRFLGVAALDVTAAYVAEAMLVPAGIGIPVDVALIDEEGLVVAGTSVPIDAKEKPPYRLSSVADAIRGGQRQGQVELGDELVVWTRLEVVPWTYVVAGPSSALVGWY